MSFEQVKENYDVFKQHFFGPIKNFANEQGLHAYILDYHSGNPQYSHAGLYLVVSPNKTYEDLLFTKDEYFGHLVDNKLNSPNTFFDANYVFVDISDFHGSVAKMDDMVQILRDIRSQAIIVNAVRDLGYNEYPTQVSKFAADELIRMKNIIDDPKTPNYVANRYYESYKKLAGHIYSNSMTNSKEHFQPLKQAKNQKVKDPAFFVKNNVPTMCTQIHQDLRPYFENAIKDHPQFYYYIDEKPSLHLKDISQKYKGDGQNIWKDMKEEKEWQITFPACYQNIVYGIINQYINKDLQNNTENKFFLGYDSDEVFSMVVDTRDMEWFDRAAGANDIPYYVNIGDLAPINRENFCKNTILVRQSDRERVSRLMEDRCKQFLKSPSVTNPTSMRPKQNATTIDYDMYQGL